MYKLLRKTRYRVANVPVEVWAVNKKTNKILGFVDNYGFKSSNNKKIMLSHPYKDSIYIGAEELLLNYRFKSMLEASDIKYL